MLRSAASKIARASPLHPRRLVGLERGSRPSPGPALLPVPRSSFHRFSSSPSAGSATPPPSTNNKDLLDCNSKVPSELDRAWARLKRETKEAAYVLMLTCLFCFGCLKFSTDAASREREKFKDDLIKAIKHEYQMIHETLDNYPAGQSMQTAEQVKERYGHNDPQNQS